MPPATERPPRALTYYGRIARILADKCVTCHRPGGVAPFGLHTFESLRGRTSMIEAVVRDGLMPPWHGASTEAWSNRFIGTYYRRDLERESPGVFPLVPPSPSTRRSSAPSRPVMGRAWARFSSAT